VEPGASLARHIPWLVATLAVAAAAALSFERLSRGHRAAVAGPRPQPRRRLARRARATFDGALCPRYG
jgi:hypothetical protein